MKVLVVDDSPAMRKFIMRVVGMTGLGIGGYGEAGNGAEAMTVLRGSSYDLILTDINMPGVDGEQFLTLLSESELPKPPVIVVSTDATDARVERMRKLGAVGYVAKPFTPEQFRAQLLSALQSQEPVEPARAPAAPDITLIQCVQHVLETMFFCPATSTPGAGCELDYTMGFGFTGGHPGRFVLTADQDAVVFLADNFMDLDEANVNEAVARQLLGELANMACGTYLSRAYPDSQFRLGTAQKMEFPLRTNTVWFELDRGLMGITLEARKQ